MSFPRSSGISSGSEVNYEMSWSTTMLISLASASGAGSRTELLPARSSRSSPTNVAAASAPALDDEPGQRERNVCGTCGRHIAYATRDPQENSPLFAYGAAMSHNVGRSAAADSCPAVRQPRFTITRRRSQWSR